MYIKKSRDGHAQSYRRYKKLKVSYQANAKHNELSVTHKVDLQGLLAWSHFDGEGLSFEVTLSLVESIVYMNGEKCQSQVEIKIREKYVKLKGE